MIIKTMKDSLKKAMFERDDVKKNILRVAIGEAEQLQMSAQQGGKPLEDEQVFKILRRIMTDNQGVLENTPEGDRRTILVRENEILDAMVPKLLTQDQIRAKLQSAGLQGPVGKAMGAAMKLFKESGDSVNGNDVKAVVESLLTTDVRN